MNKIREEINEIDLQIINLFKKRMKCVNEVLIYKKNNNLSVLDEKREIELLEKNLKILADKELEKYYKIFFEGVLESSKSYQEDNL